MDQIHFMNIDSILFTLCNRDIYLPNHPQQDYPTNLNYISDPTYFFTLNTTLNGWRLDRYENATQIT